MAGKYSVVSARSPCAAGMYQRFSSGMKSSLPEAQLTEPSPSGVPTIRTRPPSSVMPQAVFSAWPKT